MTPHAITKAIGQAWPCVTAEDIERRMLGELVLTADQAMQRDQITDLSLFGHAALSALERGQATDVDVNNLAVIANVAMLLCEIGYGAEVLDTMVAGQRAVVSLQARHARTGRAVATGPELLAIREAIALHDQQLDMAPTAREMRAVIAELNRRNKAGEHL